MTFWKKPLHIIRNFLTAPITAALQQQTKETQTSQVVSQKTLIMQYKQMVASQTPMPSLDEVGFSIYSESDEDGILLYIFAILGVTNRKLIDIGAAAINGSNTANLLVNHGWTGTLIEANTGATSEAFNYYHTNPSTKHFPPNIINQRVNTEDINFVLTENGCTGNIDLLCIDIDSIDYWIWEAITCISPRVVVVEYQCIWGPDECQTVPNDINFEPQYDGPYGIYSGASLNAFVKLAEKKDIDSSDANAMDIMLSLSKMTLHRTYCQE